MPSLKDDYHVPNGDYEVICRVCGKVIRSDSPLTRYCCKKHYQKANNDKFYQKHKEEIKERMAEYMRRKRENEGLPSLPL